MPIKVKPNKMISESIAFRIRKAKVKVGVKYLGGHECERPSVILIRERGNRALVIVL